MAEKHKGAAAARDSAAAAAGEADGGAESEMTYLDELAKRIAARSAKSNAGRG